MCCEWDSIVVGFMFFSPFALITGSIMTPLAASSLSTNAAYNATEDFRSLGDVCDITLDDYCWETRKSSSQKSNSKSCWDMHTYYFTVTTDNSNWVERKEERKRDSGACSGERNGCSKIVPYGSRGSFSAGQSSLPCWKSVEGNMSRVAEIGAYKCANSECVKIFNPQVRGGRSHAKSCTRTAWARLS